MRRATVITHNAGGGGTRRKRALERLRLALLAIGLGLLLTAAGPTAALAGATPACTDGDGDGYVVCVACDSTGKLCGECNDGDPDISPGDPELCGDTIDNDCDGMVDEGFDVGAACNVSTTNAFGTCLTNGLKECSNDKLSTICVAVGPLDVPEQEGATATDPTCFDLDDNDCDGLEDHQEPACQTAELCDGFDNDNMNGIDDTFTDLGDACTAGVGACLRNGVKVCSGDMMSTVCNAVPGGMLAEGPAGSASCSDGIDNDCDGATDFPNDSNCLQAELCDGIDNDNANGVDDGFDVGMPCTNGLLGQCLAAGVKVCSADKTGTICNATGAAPSQEGPFGPTCSDSIDNDCDGDVDLADASCVVNTGLSVECSLPYLRGKPGSDCTGKHIITYSVNDPSGMATVQAELVGLRADGTIIRTLPVNMGDEVHMKSRTRIADWRFRTRGKRHTLSAPIPLLRVTVDDGTQKVQAFCSNIPYLDIVQPGGNVTLTEGDDFLNVVAAIPNVDPATLVVKIDGVDVLAALGINPATDFPGGPYSGNVMIDGQNVMVSDLVVNSGLGITTPGANTLSMNLFDFSSAGCGSHIILVDGDGIPGIITADTTLDCQRDDVEDRATASVFAIDIATPTEGLVTSTIPTPVMGQVCSGSMLSSVLVNGESQDVSGQMFTPGDGLTSGDSYVFDIDTALPQTDLMAEIDNTATALGTFDPGSNKLVVLAEDDSSTRTAKTVNFAVGDVATTAAGALASFQAQLEAEAQGAADVAVQQAFTLAGTEIPAAFVLGLEPAAINTFFAETCTTATAAAEQKIRDSLKAKTFPSKEVNGGISCNPTVNFSITDVRFNGDIGCNVSLGTGSLNVAVVLPAIEVDLTAYGRCKVKDPVFGVCISETIVDIDATATLNGLSVDFPLTEAQFISGAQSTGTFNPGTATLLVTDDDSEVNCIAGFIGDVIDGFLDFIVTVFTFGQASNPFDLSPNFEGVFVEIDLVEKIGVQEFTTKAKEIMMNEQVVAQTMKTLEATLDSVKIRPEGITAVLKATFAPTSTDPEIEPTPGSVLNPATAPMPAVAGAGNTFFVVADDAMNQLFASMTSQGEIKTQCIASTKTVGDLLPMNCSSLILPKLVGFCEGIKRTNCESLTLAATQGACHGTQGDDCETLPVSALAGPAETERQACRDQVFHNLFTEMPLLFCGRADVPPYLLIQDDVDQNGNPVNTPNQVETHLRLNDLLVGMVVDRGGDGLQGELNALGGCFASNASTDGDCNLVATCLDLNMPTVLSLDTSGGKLQIKPTVLGVQFPPRPEGAICEGGFNFGGDQNLLSESADSDPIDDLMQNVDMLTPPLQSDGLDLGGIVNFNNPRLIAIDAAGGAPTGFQDYLGITGDIAPPP